MRYHAASNWMQSNSDEKNDVGTSRRCPVSQIDGGGESSETFLGWRRKGIAVAISDLRGCVIAAGLNRLGQYAQLYGCHL